MAGPVNYCSSADVNVFLPNVVLAEEDAIWTRFCGVASRAMDGWCDRVFYTDPLGAGTKYFDIEGDPNSGTPIVRFQLQEHDFYGLNAIKIAQRENGDPAVAGDWVTLVGDGVTPPSDFFLEPANQMYVGKTGDTQRMPSYRIELPRTAPSSSSTFQSSFLPGKRTLSITATGWGWPSIPDEINDIATKIVIRMWKAKAAGWTGMVGSPEMGTQIILKYLDINDLATLNRYKKYSAG